MALQHLSLSARNSTASQFTYFPHKYDLSAPYQRASKWTLEQRRALIKSLLMGLPIGAITINERGFDQGPNGYYAVIDGKQRVETLIAFSRDEFAIPADWIEDKYIVETVPMEDGQPGVLYTTTPRVHSYVDDASVPTINSKGLTIAGEAEIYLLVNSGGTGHTPEEIALAQQFIDGRA